MAINQWWASDARQRYWMEITDRDDVGADLLALTKNRRGMPYWGRELIRYVQPGDVVLHWHKTLIAESAIVGWSQATGVYEDTEVWLPETDDRAQELNLRPAWRMPLLNYTPMANPVLLSEVRAVDQELRQVQKELEDRHPGGALYFPFGFSDLRPLRAQQTYLVKMPVEVLDVLGLDLEHVGGLVSRTESPTGKAQKSGHSGYIADSAVRSAIEQRAVELAIATYDAEDYEWEYTGESSPYDLEVRKGSEVRRVEVKGSSGAAKMVELTHGEVNNSQSGDVPTDLFVVDGISWRREPDGSVVADGGEVRRWRDWRAEDDQLLEFKFRYTLPSPDLA